MPKIRVAHFSTSDTGGAAIAAKRLTILLKNGGIEADLFSRTNLGPFESTKLKKFAQLLIGKFVTKFQERFSVETYGTLTPISIGSTNIQRILKSDYDVIHIHNWYNLFSEADLARLSKRFPLVLTLHDERILTGGCHVTLGCKNFLSNCNKCPGLRIPGASLSKFSHFLEKIDKGSHGINLICPSQWIESQAKVSRYINHATEVFVIPNVIEMPIEVKSSFFSKKNSNVVNLLFVAANINAHVKGFSFLKTALINCASEFRERTGLKVNLAVVGASGNSLTVDSDLVVEYLGVKDSDQISKLMKDFDFLVVSSFSENLPNVISEAQLVGLPVITSNVGGIPELVQESDSGFLFPLDEQSLIDAMIRAVEFESLPEMSSKARELALSRLDNAKIFDEHAKVYGRSLGLS
jgi:glycosyltransferase involved in cell wall biosynthesis